MNARKGDNSTAPHKWFAENWKPGKGNGKKNVPKKKIQIFPDIMNDAQTKSLLHPYEAEQIGRASRNDDKGDREKGDYVFRKHSEKKVGEPVTVIYGGIVENAGGQFEKWEYKN